jgi:hypothetical protein
MHILNTTRRQAAFARGDGNQDFAVDAADFGVTLVLIQMFRGGRGGAPSVVHDDRRGHGPRGFAVLASDGAGARTFMLIRLVDKVDFSCYHLTHGPEKLSDQPSRVSARVS